MTPLTPSRIEDLLVRLTEILEEFGRRMEKEVASSELVETLDSWKEPLVAKVSLDRCDYVLKRVPKSLAPEKLTPRQEEITSLVLNGVHRKAIAVRLGISTRTVDVHLKRIFDRYRVGSAIQLVRRLLMVN